MIKSTQGTWTARGGPGPARGQERFRWPLYNEWVGRPVSEDATPPGGHTCRSPGRTDSGLGLWFPLTRRAQREHPGGRAPSRRVEV